MPRRSPIVVSVLLMASFAVMPRAAGSHLETGNLRGRILQPPQPAGVTAPAGRPGVGDLGQTSHPPIDRSRAVVYIDAAPRQAFDALPASRVKMDQRNQVFVPHLLAITVGTTVDFPNDDPFFHNVMSLARGNAFDLGRYPKGRSRSVRFDTPGIVPVICDIHAHMSAYILVFGHPFFSVTGDDGRYEIPGIPAGTYTVKVWSELGTADPRRVTIGDGAVTDADFVVKR